jgi:hypothetical protein
MSAKKIIPAVVMTLIIAVASTVFFLERREVSASSCTACKRELHPGWVFTLALKNGGQEKLCCAKCGILERLEKQSQVVSARATDYETGKTLPAEKAVYVYSSDLEHCAVPQKTDWTDHQHMHLAWDRCIPSLLAFETRAEAREFQGVHGGTVLDYNESVELVKAGPPHH